MDLLKEKKAAEHAKKVAAKEKLEAIKRERGKTILIALENIIEEDSNDDSDSDR